MEPKKITTGPAFAVVGMAIRTRNEQNEIPQMWSSLSRSGSPKAVRDL
jgi:predicted transcriptional regulator YdeE